MANWSIKCQTCQKAKSYEYGNCFACDDNECNYKPFENRASTSSTPFSPGDIDRYMENGVPQNGKNW